MHWMEWSEEIVHLVMRWGGEEMRVRLPCAPRSLFRRLRSPYTPEELHPKVLTYQVVCALSICGVDWWILCMDDDILSFFWSSVIEVRRIFTALLLCVSVCALRVK